MDKQQINYTLECMQILVDTLKPSIKGTLTTFINDIKKELNNG